jgi:hypothetical protein
MDVRTNLGRIGHDKMKYKGTPQACVARTISTARSDGRLLRSHFIVWLPFTFPSALMGTDNSIQPACTHDRKPLNIIAVLMTTALGK